MEGRKESVSTHTDVKKLFIHKKLNSSQDVEGTEFLMTWLIKRRRKHWFQ